MTALNSGWTFDGVALNSAGAYAIRLLSPDEEVDRKSTRLNSSHRL